MDWRLRIASRPVAVKQGPYANAASNYRTYFATDAKNPVPAFADVDSDVPDEERLNPYQRMTLSTDQTWNIQSEGWQKMAGNYLQATVPSNETLRERAQRELAYAL